MKVTLDLTGSELTLLYLATGNEDAGRIIRACARELARLNPPEKKPRSRGRWPRNDERKEEAQK